MMTHDKRELVIGTRGSPLALVQARLTAEALAGALDMAAAQIRIEVISTTGDRTQDRPLAEIGGKGLFTKEIDLAQLEGRVDVAVHSAKDLPTALPAGLSIAGYLPREDIRDALIAPRYGRLANLPPGARIGTVSLRRQALIAHVRPDLVVEGLRGNVETRLAKARSGAFDGVILAVAGLTRLGLAGAITEALDAATFVPAVGQGAIALVARTDDPATQRALAPITHRATGIELAAERAFLAVLDGSCRTPIGGSARLDGERIRFHGIVLAPDGSQAETAHGEAGTADAADLGARLGAAIKARLAAAATPA